MEFEVIIPMTLQSHFWSSEEWKKVREWYKWDGYWWRSTNLASYNIVRSEFVQVKVYLVESQGGVEHSVSLLNFKSDL